MMDDIKQGKLPTGFADRYVEEAHRTIELLSFNKVLDKAFSRVQAQKDALNTQSRMMLYEMRK